MTRTLPAAGVARSGGMTRRLHTPWPLDLARTLAIHRRGRADPAYRIRSDGSIWRAVHTPDGAGTIAVSRDGDTVSARAWGPGAQWLLESMPALIGAHDDPGGLVPRDRIVASLVARATGVRIGRSDRVWEALAPAVLEQKVLGAEAWRAWRHLLMRFGEVAPGAPDMRVPPEQRRWREIPSWEWHRSGAEPVRMRTIWGATAMNVEKHHDHLTLLRGVGPWTEAETRARAVGDVDAVPVGDYHIPSMVGTTLIGEPVDDDGMLELLEPYAGQRYRVIRLIILGGARSPRRGPRLAMRDYRSF